jgi:hypothetical protein
MSTDHPSTSVHGTSVFGFAALWAGIFAACVGGIAFLVRTPEAPAPSLPEAPQAPTPASPVAAAFFDSEVQPAIAKADRANREAATRCVQRIQEMFAKDRRGIDPFIEDLTSWGTRFGVVRRMPSDWWYKRSDVKEVIAAKFEKHLFSEKSLHDGIEGALDQFRKDVEANNNELLTAVNAAVSRRDLPNMPPIKYRQFSAEVTESLRKFAAEAAVDNVTTFLITELASGVGGEVATQLTLAIATRMATMAAEATAAAGGATAGGAAVGGGGGSLGGPAGTAIGLGVGLVIGVGIDWWMTNSFKEKMSGQLNKMIDQVESSVLQGTDDKSGLRVSLDTTCDALCDSYRQSLYDRIVRGSKS